MVGGSWWAFDEEGYLAEGWIYDTAYRGWFYIDVNVGMLYGWHEINGKWYYLNPVSDGTKGIMLADCVTPDGYYVDPDGAWDGQQKRASGARR